MRKSRRYLLRFAIASCILVIAGGARAQISRTSAPTPGLLSRESIKQLRPVASPSPLAEKEPLKLIFLDVGHGDACLIQCPTGENILIDGGSGRCETFVVQALRGAGVEKIDILIATHPHADHVGSLGRIIREIPVRLVLDSGKPHTTSIYRRFLEAVKESPETKYALGRAGQKFVFGAVELFILHPGESLPSKINDCSIVCRLTYGDFSTVFTGDAEKRAEKEIRRRGYTLRSDVLKVGHHGSNTSTTSPFLRAVSPEVAVVSCRASSSRRYHSEVLRRLRISGAKVYRTGENGTIVIESTGEGYTVTPSRDDAKIKGTTDYPR